MTITATPSEIAYTGNGVTLSFAIPFVFDTSADLKVYSTVIATGVITELTTGFTVTGGSGSTGNIAFSVAPASTVTITILDDPALTQPADYISNDAFPAETHERALDRVTRISKRIYQTVQKTLRVRDGDASSGDDLLLPTLSSRASKFLAFDANGNPIASEAVSDGDALLRAELIAGASSLVKSTAIKYDITPAEDAEGVTPSVYSRKPLQKLVAETDRYASIANALTVLQGGSVLQSVYYFEDWLPSGHVYGTDDAAAPLNALIDALYAINIHDTSNSRRAMPIIQLPARSLRFKTPLDVGNAAGTMGFTIQGVGAWATTIYFDAGTAGQITGLGASHLTFKGICFRADAIDDDVVTFAPSTSGGGALRRWTFDHCDWFYVWKPFVNTGSSLCDEFKLIGCNFLECYHVVDNDNDQAVNWNFYGCDFEATLDGNTTKNVDSSTMFLLKKGMLVNWMGGSLLLPGAIVVLNTTSSNNFSINSHAMNFDGVRLELIDSATANGHTVGTHVSLVNRIASGYANVNNLKLTLQNFTMLHRGTLPGTMDLFDLRDNWTIVIRNGESEAGRVKGYYTSNTITQAGFLLIDNCKGITYTEDTTDRINSYVTHEVTVIPNNGSDGALPVQINRSPGTTGLRATLPQCLYVQDLNGNLPQGGTTKNIPTLLNHTILRTLVLQQFETSTQTLTVQLRDQADTTTYASVSLVAGSGGGRENRAAIGLVVGFQIGTEATPVPLMLKFVGTPDTQKGAVWIEYM